MNPAALELTLEDMQGVGLALLEEGLHEFAARLNGVETPTERLVILTSADTAGRIRLLREYRKKLEESRPEAAEKLACLECFLRPLDLDASRPTGQDDPQPAALDWLRAVLAFVADLRGLPASEAAPQFQLSPDRQGGIAIVPPDENLRFGIAQALDDDLRATRFVAAVMDACMDARMSPSKAPALSAADDAIALEKAYSLLDDGVRLPKVIKPLYKSDRRDHQTYLSFADPGPGHLKGTVRDSKLLSGTIVHIEWIDRDNVDDKSDVEAYRLPALRSAARVRLHVGDETPCTVFIGRPVFEGVSAGQPMSESVFRKALLKAAHTVASTCSSMFALGIVDCKVAMDGLSTEQAVEFMRAVAGNVVRDPGVQMLSAAFNVNTPLRVDRQGEAGATLPLVHSIEIARRGVELVRAGRFDKIAWDGASNRQPSLPIISQLTMPKLLELVHFAHERRLETYISAGLEPTHMRWATYAGVGGVGIGTSLHYVNPVGKLVGEIRPDKVSEALQTRDAAAATSLGRAAAVLARLDWRYGECSLADELNGPRLALFELLSTRMPGLEGRLHELMALEEQIRGAAGDKARATLAERLKEWSECENKDNEIDSLLAEIDCLQKEVASKAATTRANLQVPAPNETFGAKVRLHPAFERAERTLELYDSREKAATENGWDREMLEALRKAFESGRVDVLNDLFTRFDERRLY